MKNKLIASIMVFYAATIFPQTKLSLEECYSKARENYPLIKQKEYIAKSKDYNVSNVWKGYFPQLTINGQATYQNEVTTIPISLPGINIESISKDQYKAVADVSQVIYDGGVMSTQAEIQKSAAEVDDQKIEIELLKVKDRINQIYFGILLFNEQLIQTDLVKKDLVASFEKLNAALKNGTAMQSNVDVIKAELLKTNQKEIELKSSRKSFIDMLGLLINQLLEESVELVLPIYNQVENDSQINRPELKMYSSQQKMIEEQSGLTLSKILPKASLFFQGGYGKPGFFRRFPGPMLPGIDRPGLGKSHPPDPRRHAAQDQHPRRLPPRTPASVGISTHGTILFQSPPRAIPKSPEMPH